MRRINGVLVNSHNLTYEELKLDKIKSTPLQAPSHNLTYEELKLQMEDLRGIKDSVIILPMRN